MAEESYDVVVVGAGPAGSSAARCAAAAGARVALLEREEEVAATVRTSGVTWVEDAEAFGIPRRCYNAVSNYGFCSPSNSVVVRGAGPGAAVLDVRGTYRWLAGKAEEAGAEIRTGTAATGAVVEGGRVVGVDAASGGSRRRFRAGVVVDASGFHSVVANSAGLAAPWRRFGAGAEYEARAERADPDTWWLMVGSAYSPAGYAWIFPLGGRMVRVGVGVGKPDSAVDPARRLDELVRDRPGPLAGLGRLDVVESHRGLIPNGGLARRTAYDGLLLAGDSAGQANPLVLEGIRYAIRFGGDAGRAAASAAASGDASAAALGAYEAGWRAAVQSRIRAAGRVQDRWMRLDDAQWDRELDAMRGLSADEFLDFIRADFGLFGMAGMAARHPGAAAKRLFWMVRDAASRRPAGGGAPRHATG